MSTIKANTIENLGGDESHDVATMGIKHQDTSASLKSIKFPDGTLICTGNAGTGMGTSVQIVYDIPFVGDKPHVSISVTCANSNIIVTDNFNNDNNQKTFTSNMSVEWYINYIAIGRWK